MEEKLRFAIREGGRTVGAGIVASIITQLLDELPARRVPPKSLPPLRRPEVQARIAERMQLREEHERMHELGIAHSH
jgi:hypothetical protein